MVLIRGLAQSGQGIDFSEAAVNREIFREYDLRGVWDEDFNSADVETIGRGFGTCLRRRGSLTVVVGRDGRLSSPEIREALVAGLLQTGLKVMDLGVCPTPVVYFALWRLEVGGGLMITASHNPPEYNGFKICVGSENIFGREIQEFRQVVEDGRFEAGKGSLERIDMIGPYREFLIDNLKVARPVRAAADAGNATAGVVAGPIFEALGCPVIELFFDLDGRFPNHEPDPTVPGNMEALAETVVGEGLELGLGFDGDADRLGVVDEKGGLIFGDRLLLIFAREMLKANPGGRIIGEVKCSHLMYNDISARGGQAVMWRAGHSLIKQKLREEKAVLAGEMSGHYCFADRYFGFDDAIYAAGRLLEIVARKKEPLSRYLADLPPTVSTPEIRVPCPEEQKFRLVEMVKEELKSSYEVIDLDGVRVVFPDGWGLLRASNTGPILVLRFEAESEARLEQIRELMEGTLEKAKARL